MLLAENHKYHLEQLGRGRHQKGHFAELNFEISLQLRFRCQLAQILKENYQNLKKISIMCLMSTLSSPDERVPKEQLDFGFHL